MQSQSKLKPPPPKPTEQQPPLSSTNYSTSLIHNGQPLNIPTDAQLIITQYTILRLHILIRQIKALLIRVKAGNDKTKEGGKDDRVIPLMNYILNLSGVFVLQTSGKSGIAVFSRLWELDASEELENIMKLKNVNVRNVDLNVGSGQRYDIKGSDSTSSSVADYANILSSLVLTFESLLLSQTKHLKTIKLTKVSRGELLINFDLIIKPLIETPIEIQSMIKFIISPDRIRHIHYITKIPIVLDLLTKQLAQSLTPFVEGVRDLQSKMLETYLKKISYWGSFQFSCLTVLIRLNEIQWCLGKFYKDMGNSYEVAWKKLKSSNERFRTVTEKLDSQFEGKVDFISEYLSAGETKIEFNMQNVSEFSQKSVSKYDETVDLLKIFEKLIQIWKEDVEKQNKVRNSQALQMKSQQISRTASLRVKPQPLPVSLRSPNGIQPHDDTQPKSNKLSSTSSQTPSTDSSLPSSPITSPLIHRSNSLMKKPASHPVTITSPTGRSRSGSTNSLTSPIKPPVSTTMARQRSNSNSLAPPSSTAPVNNNTVTPNRQRSGSSASVSSQTSSILNSQRNNSLTSKSNSKQTSPSPSVSRSGSVRKSRPQSIIMNQSFDIRTQLRRQQLSPQSENQSSIPSSLGNLPTMQAVQSTPKPNFKSLKGAGVTRARSSSLQGSSPSSSTDHASAAASAMFKAKSSNSNDKIGVGIRANSLQSIIELSQIRELQMEPIVGLKSSLKKNRPALEKGIVDEEEQEEQDKVSRAVDQALDCQPTETQNIEEDEEDFGSVVIRSFEKVQQISNDDGYVVTPVKQIIRLNINDTDGSPAIEFTEDQPSPASTPLTSPTPVNITNTTNLLPTTEQPSSPTPQSKDSTIRSSTPSTNRIDSPIIKKVRFTGIPTYSPEEDKPKRKGMSASLALKFKNPMLNGGFSNNGGGGFAARRKDDEFLKQERMTFVRLRQYPEANGEAGQLAVNTGSGLGQGKNGLSVGKWKIFR